MITLARAWLNRRDSPGSPSSGDCDYSDFDSRPHLAMPIHLRLSVSLLACWLLLVGIDVRANPALEGYANEAAFQERLKKLDESDLARVTSLGKTVGGREVSLITLGSGDIENRPAILIVGNVQAAQVVGSEAVLRMAERLVAQAATDDKIKRLLGERTLYLLPQPSPDATAKCFVGPFREPQGNATITDDDRDGERGEDPPEDLNGDGWITIMRIEDTAGEYIPHPDDPRVLIRAEPTKNERGKYRVLTEGRDNDGDEKWNEDAGDGVAFNRNFTFNYPAFKSGAGPNQVSEIETRAIADFCFDHPHISSVWTITPEDNLLQPWKADGAKDKARIRTTILSGDAAYQDYLAGLYQKLREPKGLPGSPGGEGSYSEWGYFHYGRWSYASRFWWIPPVEVKPAEGEKEKKSEEKRGAEDLHALRYFAEQRIDGFVNWTPIEHPDFPGQKVEVGGFKPFYRTNPAVGLIDELVGKQVDFIVQVQSLAPKLTFNALKAQSLGGGVVRLTAKLQNDGYLPTMPEMGEVNGQAYPLQIAWSVPEKTIWLQGAARSRLPRLVGQGGQIERTWLLRLPEPVVKELRVKVYAPSVGSVDATVEVK